MRLRACFSLIAPGIGSALLAPAPMAFAQQAPAAQGPTVEDMARLRQDPVSGLRSVFLQNETTTVNGQAADVFSVQPVWPFPLGEDWRLITYTILPMASLPALASGGTDQGSGSGLQSLPTATPAENPARGLGNVLFDGFISPRTHQGSFVWGAGPVIQLPTRSNPALGSSRVSAGPALLLYDTFGPWAGGVVLQNYWSLGGFGTNRVNNGSAQYILYYNFPDGWSWESNATVTADWLASPRNRWNVPIGGGVSKTFQIGSLFYSASLQGFYNAERPTNAGAWSVIAQLQIIFSQ